MRSLVGGCRTALRGEAVTKYPLWGPSSKQRAAAALERHGILEEMRETQSLPRSRARLYAAICLVAGCALGLGGAEAWARVAKPTPPVQIVRRNVDGVAALDTLHGLPVWRTIDLHPRACAEAHPERQRVMFLGSSITHGTDPSGPSNFTIELEQRLNAARPNPGFCVMNFAESGFTAQLQQAVGSAEIPRYRPALVLWEVWAEPGRWVLLGDTAYDLYYFKLRRDGYPGLYGVPDGLNHALLARSRFYEYLTLRFGRRDPNARAAIPGLMRTLLQRLTALTHASGARLAFYQCPRLDMPFREAGPAATRRDVQAFAEAQGIPMYNLYRELADQDYRALRADPCCHFNAAGHHVLAGIFERIVLEALDGRPAPR